MRLLASNLIIALIWLPCCWVNLAYSQDNPPVAGLKSSQSSVKQKKPVSPAFKQALDSKTTAQVATDKKPTPPQPISSKRRGELMKFVDTHHQELRPLLNQLKKHRPQQYQTVLRTLDRNVKNLQGMERNSPSRYQRSLEQWVLASRIQLLTAQLAIKKSEKEKAKLRSQIRPLIEEQANLRLAQLLIDTEQAKKRYAKLQSQLDELKPNQLEWVNRRMAEIDKTSKRFSAQNDKTNSRKKSDPRRKKPDQTGKQKRKSDSDK